MSGESHREAVWGPDAFHPGYGKGVCVVDGDTWPCAASDPQPCWNCGKYGHQSGLLGSSPVPVPSPEPLDLRAAVWSAQHDLTCEDAPPHPWTDHLPWDSAEDEQDATRQADAIIAALRSVPSAEEER